MFSNVNQSSHFDVLNSINLSLIEKWILFGITISGIVINILTMIYLLFLRSSRIKSSCFLIHHCIICLILSILCIPYSLSYFNYSVRCDYLGNLQVTCVTAQLLNMAAMVASEAYRFEDLIHQDNIKENVNNLHFQSQLKETNPSTISCGCLSFGLIIIWFCSIILHLGITMIGSESKSYYDEKGQNCYFLIRDIRGYVLTLMWIIITIFSLIITIRYIKKVLDEISLKRRDNQPLLSLAILGQSHGQSIATKDILMQQIEQRIKLNIILIILFIIFWFPLFIFTLYDIHFNTNKLLTRCLLLLSWSNSSISPLIYLLFLSKLGCLCSFCVKKDRLSTYDSLTSYYNRIGDRFHDVGKWDQLKKDQIKKKTNFTLDKNQEEEEEEEEEEDIQLKQIRSSEKKHPIENSLFVKEISVNEDQTSSTSSLTTITNKHLSNGLIVTNIKH